MEYWDWVRSQIDEASGELGWTLADVAREAGIKYNRLHAFARGENETIRRDALLKIANAIHRDLLSGPHRQEKVDAGQAPGDTIHLYGIEPLKPDEIPVVYIWEFPPGIPEGQMRARLSDKRRGAYKRLPTDPPDPDLVWVRLRERLGDRMEEGDDVLMSPAATDSVQDGSFVIIEAGEEVVAAQLQVVDGRRAAKTRSGRRFEHGKFKILGKIIRFSGEPR